MTRAARTVQDAGAGTGGGAGAGGEGAQPHVLYVRFEDCRERDYPHLLGVLHGLTPLVQALPPDAALADVRGALRYFGRDAAGLARLARARALALYGTDCTVGVAATPLLARMAAQDGPPCAVREVRPVQTAGFLAPKPVAALYGVGPATARTLRTYGFDTIGRVAGAPPATLQRVLGATAGRRLRERARGIDPTPVVPGGGSGGGSGAGGSVEPARSVEYSFERDELDAVRRRRALLTLADELGFGMRTEERAARALCLTVRYADRSTTVRTRRLTEPTAHTPALTAAAYALHDALGLQRARVRALALRADELVPAELAARQLSFDPGEERARRAEAAADRARHRFGGTAAHPAGWLGAA